MANSNETIKLDQAQSPLFVGIDVGGTNTKLGLLDSAGSKVAHLSIPTGADQGPETAVERIAESVSQLLKVGGAARNDVARIGLATPGPMDLTTGVLLTPGNLPTWWDFPIRDRVAEACQLPVRFANDANAAAYGEFWRGAGEAYHSMVMFTLGTGIGGGIIIGDLLIEGSHGAGGECGHILIDPREDAPRDSLGKTGTLEAFCGSYAVVARATEALASGRESSLHEFVNSQEGLTPRLIADAAEAGDALALDVVMDTARYLALGIVTLTHTIDPDCVVLGGAMTFGGEGHPLGEKFLQKVRDETTPRLFRSLRDEFRIGFAKLAGDAGYIGAAGLARLEHLQLDV